MGKRPTFPQLGGCQCGAVRYELGAKPIVFYICHCSECQKQSSSAFGESMRVHIADLTIRGEPKSRRRGVSVGQMSGDFCGQCGTRLFHRREPNPGVLNIKAGSLDDTTWLRPAGHIWTKSKQPWVFIPSDALQYEGQPENYDELTKAWDSYWSNLTLSDK